MSKPIIVKAWKTVEGELVNEEWSYERIFELWNNDEELMPQLARRCQDYEERLEKLAAEWFKYKEFLETKHSLENGEEWEWYCPYHNEIANILEEEL